MTYLSPQQLQKSQLNPTELKKQLATLNQVQTEQFLKQTPVDDLVLARAAYMDKLLQRLWCHFGFSEIKDLALIAVGGYGRSELHPLSDIDILILTQYDPTSFVCDKVSQFITLLWDLKLEIGHSVRSIDQCIEIGQDDLTVATNLQEARLICGSESSFSQLQYQIQADDFWPSADFYKAKLIEQKNRHARYHNTAYNLEPDIKSSPGGLRDIHTLSWIARRHFGATSLLEMSRYGFLTDAEYRELLECQNYLWQVRFALHIELKRYDNRLSFAYQAKVAKNLGFSGEKNQPVEKMMKEFYRTLRRISELNRMLIKLFDQAIVNKGVLPKAEVISDDFQRRGELIEARKPALFQARPDTILDMFLHIASDATIVGVAPATMRQLRTARRRLNRFLVTLPMARDKFMLLMRHPNVLAKALPLMHKLGVLTTYFPQWSQIVGQMQFDLFHAYTVDEHSARLLKHIHSFNLPESRDKHPICCDLLPRMAKQELLILAAIFHDIGKGRGGDHSEIGAIEAYQFCIEHGLSKPDSKLVFWLVRNHLLMSITAQKRDIHDPDVITEFAKIVRSEEYLEALLCLTVADICATNPDLWNSWKRTLLSELFYSTQRALRLGLENPVDIRDRIRHTQQLAATKLGELNYTSAQVNQLWGRFKADYFLRHTPDQICWHCEALLNSSSQTEPLVMISQHNHRGGSEVFVYHKDQDALFASIVAELDRRNLNIYDAQIMTSKDGYVLDTFLVLQQDGRPIDPDRHSILIRELNKVIGANNKATNIRKRRVPHNLKHFKVKTQVELLPNKSNKQSLIEFRALDTPGLLATVSAVFSELQLHLHSAKITTIGERAEDLFILSSKEGTKLNKQQLEQLKTRLKQVVSELVPD